MASNITIQGAKIIFKNFEGKGTQYNQPGNRTFAVILDEELAEVLKQDGWNVKRLHPREDDPDQIETQYLNVRVKYGTIPPTVFLITSRGKIQLNEETIGQLDWTIFENCDVIIRPYNYPEMPGRPAGISAYLKAMYVTIREDDLSIKYAEIPDIV